MEENSQINVSHYSSRFVILHILLFFLGSVLTACVPRKRNLCVFVSDDSQAMLRVMRDVKAEFELKGEAVRIVRLHGQSNSDFESATGLKAFWLLLCASQVCVNHSISEVNRYVLRRASVTVLFPENLVQDSLSGGLTKYASKISDAKIAQIIVPTERQAVATRLALSVVPARVIAIALDFESTAKASEKAPVLGLTDESECHNPVSELATLMLQNMSRLSELTSSNSVFVAVREDRAKPAMALMCFIATAGPDKHIYWEIDTFAQEIPAGVIPVLRGGRTALAASNYSRLKIIDDGVLAYKPKKHQKVLCVTNDWSVKNVENDIIFRPIAEYLTVFATNEIMRRSARHRLGLPLNNRLLLYVSTLETNVSKAVAYIREQKDAWVITDSPITGLENQVVRTDFDSLLDAVYAGAELVTESPSTVARFGDCFSLTSDFSALELEMSVVNSTGSQSSSKTYIQEILSVP